MTAQETNANEKWIKETLAKIDERVLSKLSEKPSDGTVDVEDVAAEKAREYALSLPGGERTTAVGSTYSESGYYHGFVDGSDWQKEQILKEAIEGVVSARFGTISIPHNIYERYDGQKVKLIIVKED